MIFPGFVGPSYTTQSRLADVEQSKNLYVEHVESGIGKNKSVLYGRPGLSVYVTIPDTPVRCVFYQDGRCFAIAGALFGEITVVTPTTGLFTQYGIVSNDTYLATICSNGSGASQLFIVSGGSGYIFTLTTNVFEQIPAVSPVTAGNNVFPAYAQSGLFGDGFFLVLQKSSDQMWQSNPEDGLTWSGLNTAQRSTTSDVIQAFAILHRELWLFGSKSTEVWYDAGPPTGFVFQSIPGATIQIGAFPYSLANIDNGLLWIGQDENGNGMAFRSNGYAGQRISTFAVEYAWSQYSTIADVECFSYQEQGHAFYVVNFPTANHTWVYDTSTGLWHERDWYNAVTGHYERALPRCHALAFGLHLVGDRQSGNVYLQSLSNYDDNGTQIHRRRRAPHLSQEQQWVYYRDFQLDADVGLGIPSNLGQAPQVTLRWSDDGGYTWSNDYQVGLGRVGQYLTRALWRRLGRSRDRVYEIEIAERTPVRLINAYLTAEKGTS